jgi:hypothetical protein
MLMLMPDRKAETESSHLDSGAHEWPKLPIGFFFFFFFLIKDHITKILIFALYTFYSYSPSLSFYSRSFLRY